MIKESIVRLLNKEEEATLLLDKRGEILFLNTVAFSYFKDLGNKNSLIAQLTPDTEASLRKVLSQQATLGPAIRNFNGIIETEYVQIPTRFWMKRTPTSGEDVFVVLLEVIVEAKITSEPVSLYKAIADHSPNIVSVYDTDFNCIYVNHNAYLQLGHSLSDYYTNKGFIQFIEPYFRPEVTSALEKDTQNQVQSSKYYYLARTKSGEWGGGGGGGGKDY